MDVQNDEEHEFSKKDQHNQKDLFQNMIAELVELKVEEQDQTIKTIFNRQGRKHVKKTDFKKILNSSSSNQKLPTSLKNDSSSLDHSDRARNVFETQNSMDEESFRKSFKKRYQESFSVENTIRDSSSQFSQRSDSKSNQNQNILPSQIYQQQSEQPKKNQCNCKRSRCLKLYCQCFQKKLFCNKNCNCYGCGNKPQNINQHKQAIIQALSRNAHGFQEEDIKVSQNFQQKGFSLGIEIQQVKRGCKCRKTHCLKKYCQCYQNESYCGIFCRCQECLNTSYNEKMRKQQQQQPK